MLTDARLNQIWRAGFCIDLVHWSKRPEASVEKERLAYLAEHQLVCRDCHFANILKGLEMEVAEAMGPEAKMSYLMGKDISQMEGFQEPFRRILGRATAEGRVTPLMLSWMTQVARRRDYEWRT